MQPFGELRVLGQSEARRRLCQPGGKRIARIVFVAEEMRMGVKDAVRQKGEDFPFKK